LPRPPGGRIQPATLLALARGMISGCRPTRSRPARLVRFPTSRTLLKSQVFLGCLRTPEHRLIARGFWLAQAAQNIRYSEVTYTAFTHYATGRALPTNCRR